MMKYLRFAIIATFAVATLQCCGSSDSSKNSDGLVSTEIQKKADDRIKRIAIEDANELIDSESDKKLLEENLLKIKAKEGALRDKQLNATADLYISIIKQMIIDSSPSITAELGLE